jgi:hypothetical protein
MTPCQSHIRSGGSKQRPVQLDTRADTPSHRRLTGRDVAWLVSLMSTAARSMRRCYQLGGESGFDLAR